MGKNTELEPGQIAMFDSGKMPETINREELARLLDIKFNRISQLCREGLPKLGHGTYPLVACVQWRITYWRNKKNPEIDTHRKRLLTAQAKKAEIDNDIRTRDLIPVELIASTLNQVATTVASQLDAIAPRMANELTNQNDPAFIKQALQNETNQIRTAIAELIHDLADIEDVRADSETAADQDGEPVGEPGTDTTP